VRVTGHPAKKRGTGGSRVTGCAIVTAFLMCLSLAGCGATYPKEKLKEAIIDLCKREYTIDVKVTTVGNTIGIYVPLSDLIDFTFSLTGTAKQKINDVILGASRVVLSTDANYEYYCLIAHDIRIPEIQIVIIKTVDDVRRFQYGNISMGEYSKRILIDMRFSPQARKEKAIRDVFEKMSVDKKWQEDILNDFFRAEPTALGDIGYWNDRFYLKDIKLPEFLAEQIASRIKIRFKEEKALAKIFMVKSSKGTYATGRETGRVFRFEVLTEHKYNTEDDEEALSNKVLEHALREAALVLDGYKFGDFDYVEVIDQAQYRILRASRDELDRFRLGKIKFADIVKR